MLIREKFAFWVVLRCLQASGHPRAPGTSCEDTQHRACCADGVACLARRRKPETRNVRAAGCVRLAARPTVVKGDCCVQVVDRCC